ncbi:MAG: carboxylating nicotinate-nucleotide diphosphorylase [Thermoplasmatota archaeon]
MVAQEAKSGPSVARDVAEPTVDWIGLYLLEDLGSGDVTTQALVAPDREGVAHIVAREPLVAAGVAVALELFQRLGATALPRVQDGTSVPAGTILVEVRGPAAAILEGERVALNALSRMSGIASLTRALVDRVALAGAKTEVAATRKTTPGFRWFEKRAVELGGGHRHRAGLYDAAMVKDNHRPSMGLSVAQAVEILRKARPGVEVCIEVETEGELVEAAQAAPEWILIDNQEPGVGEAWARRARGVSPATRIEASGGISPATLERYLWADRVSLGWLTQKAPGRDVGLDWGPA